jgi:hypothetical protein
VSHSPVTASLYGESEATSERSCWFSEVAYGKITLKQIIEILCFKLGQTEQIDLEVIPTVDHAIAQAVSRRLPTAAALVRSQVRSCGICGGQSGTGAGFLRVLRFPLPILSPPTAPYSSSIILGWYNRPTVADVPSGLSLTPPRETKKKNSGCRLVFGRCQDTGYPD